MLRHLARCGSLVATLTTIAGCMAYAQEGAVPVADKEFFNAVLTLYEGSRVPAEFLDAVARICAREVGMGTCKDTTVP